MVFQTFALLPWLTVLENVEFGLEAQVCRRSSVASALSMHRPHRSRRLRKRLPQGALGGMRQRVGFARRWWCIPGAAADG